MERNGKGSFVHQYYKPTEIICGRQMKEWLPFSVSWWHNLGSQSMKGQFKHTSGILYEAEKAELAFEMMKRLDIFVCRGQEAAVRQRICFRQRNSRSG